MTSSSVNSSFSSNNFPKLQDFLLVEVLGSGTYATVYKGYRKLDVNETPYAIKCIAKSSLNKKSVENLLVEIEILKQIKHEHVVQLLDFQWDGPYIFLIMEYCAGGDLLSFIQAKKFIPESIARRFLQQIASALQLLHANNISHLDLKPQNILLSSIKNPVLKLADFGFAQYIEKNQDFHIRGTPLYMAPEMLLKHQYDAKVDLWSVGVILYESLFGHPPFASKSFGDLEVKIKSNQAIQIPSSPAVSNECRHLLQQLLQRNPQERMSFESFFDDPFVDLEHKPSKDCLDKAKSLVTKAIEEDKKGNLSDSVQLYMQAVEYFVSAIYYERDARKKDILREKVNEYCHRAEQLKHLLKPSDKILEFSSLKNLIQLLPENSSAMDGLKHITSARTLDTEEKYHEALKAYERGLTLLLSSTSEQTNPLRKNLLRELIETSLKRAEDIKDYIKVHDLNEVTSQRIDEADKKSNFDCNLQ